MVFHDAAFLISNKYQRFLHSIKTALNIKMCSYTEHLIVQHDLLIHIPMKHFGQVTLLNYLFQ